MDKKRRDGGRERETEGGREGRNNVTNIAKEGGERDGKERGKRQLASDSCSLCNRSRSGEIS